MKKSNYIKPTDSELEILQLLWINGTQTVREVNDILNKHREIGYTTTLKLMQIMSDKRLVLRDTSKRQHIYSAQANEESTKKGLLRQFLSNTFGGSVSKLVLQALGDNETSKEKLEEIKALIEAKESKK